MKNRDLYRQDPLTNDLLNNGVAAVTGNDEDTRVLQYELRTFVCEGEYAKGLSLILTSYLGNVEKPEQPAVWVSGFYGSGKSHLVKMLRYLWTDFTFDDKATARGLTNLPSEIQAHLKELSTKGRQNAGLHAAAGTLGGNAGGSVPLAVLRVLFKSLGLPEEYAAAKFVLWLKSRGHLDKLKAGLKKAGEDFNTEIDNLYVSTPLAEALMQVDPKIGSDPAAVLKLIEQQFPSKQDITIDEMVKSIQDALAVDKKVPCTAIILDEAQQFIGGDANRSYMVQEVTEALSKRFNGKIVVIGTGQEALTTTAQLSRLKGRFTRNIHLSDTDVETVIRKVVLEKRPDKEKDIAKVLDICSGEISRHLVGTRIEPKNDDGKFMVADYPLLPVRQRFWERVLRNVDAEGKSGQLRTQLKIAHEAACASADGELGTVVPANFIFDQIATEMLQSGVLPGELHRAIVKYKAGSVDDKLKGALCALIFLISKLPRESGADLGIRAKPDVLADLLVADLKAGSANIRKKIPELLYALADEGRLLQIEGEFLLQTEESTAWEMEYRQRLAKVLADDARIAQERADLFKRELAERLKDVKLIQGKSKQPRKIEVYYGGEKPEPTDGAVPVWVRNGWDESESSVTKEAQAAGVDSPLITVFVPKRAAEDLKKYIASQKAAEDTLAARGVPSNEPGQVACDGMQSRANISKTSVENVFNFQILPGLKVILAGGQEFVGITLAAAVKDAADSALLRLFPQFDTADHKDWPQVIQRAKAGSGTAMEVVGYKGNVESHPVCSAILAHVGAGKKGSEVRKHFDGTPYGWPRDAVDAALMVLVGSGHLRASQSGKPVERQQLDQARIPMTDFRLESTTITASQRIAIRGLFQSVGIACAPNEESAKAPQFLLKMLELAAEAGGDPPLPARPITNHIRDMQTLAGNDQLAAIFDGRVQLDQEAKQWQAAAKLAEKRVKRWASLTALHAYADGMPVAADVQPQIEAIADNRSLLANPDPVPALCDKLASDLRAALVKAHGECRTLHEAQWESLSKQDAWKKLPAEERPRIAADCHIKPISDIAVGTEDDLLSSLGSNTVEDWRTLHDALPARFQKAMLDAARFLEPKASRVTLPSATLKTEKDLDEWLAAARDQISGKLKDGPVIV